MASLNPNYWYVTVHLVDEKTIKIMQDEDATLSADILEKANSISCWFRGEEFDSALHFSRFLGPGRSDKSYGTITTTHENHLTLFKAILDRFIELNRTVGVDASHTFVTSIEEDTQVYALSRAFSEFRDAAKDKNTTERGSETGAVVKTSENETREIQTQGPVSRPRTYKSSVDLRKRVMINAETIKSLLSELQKGELIFDHAAFNGVGFTWSTRSQTELLKHTEAEFADADEISLCFEGASKGTSNVYFWFRRCHPKKSKSGFAHRSKIRAEAQDINFYYRVLAIREFLEDRLEDNAPLSLTRFTTTSVKDSDSLGPAEEGGPLKSEVSDDDGSGEKKNVSTSAGLPQSKQKKSVVAILGLLVAFGTMLYIRRQSDAADKGNARDDSALLTLSRTPPHPPTNSSNSSIVQLDLRLDNAGRSAATNVALQCSIAEYHGPYLLLGTIAPTSHKDLELNINTNPTDLLRSKEDACLKDLHVSFEDGTGKHFVTFDEAGNPKSEAAMP